jgi:hypothetical protein
MGALSIDGSVHEANISLGAIISNFIFLAPVFPLFIITSSTVEPGIPAFSRVLIAKLESIVAGILI